MQAYTMKMLKARLLAMMVLRVVLAIAFLGITTWFQVRTHSPASLNFPPLYGIVAAVGVLTILYALLVNRVRNLGLFTYCQVTVDLALATIIVYITGGTESYLHALYPLSVIGAAILLGKRGGFYAASVASIAYGVLMDMDFYGMLPSKYKVISGLSQPAWGDVFLTVSTNILAFFTVAYLAGYLAERMARMEKRLEEKEIDYEKLENLNRQIVENITSGIMTVDGNGRITSFNREAENVTGYALKDVYYTKADAVFPGMLSPPEAVQGPSRLENSFKKKNGDDVYLGFSVSKGQGGEMDRIIIFQDLTRLKAMEEELRRDEKLKALGEMSVGIAHEIRNPLASISGSIQLLREDVSPSGEDARLMDIILRETDRLNRLITDYLLFARPAREARETVELASLVSETVNVFRNSPEAAVIKIENGLVGPYFVSGDPRQLGQVFWNLFVNAAQAMEGGGTLTVSSGSAGGIAPFVEITVSDTGKGMTREEMKRIFDPFFSTKDKGTGLGLAIVHRIIESHNGRIEVRSSPGGGSSFRITLPAEGAGALN